jgi:TRAP-type C4-dicarboxylate transport system permease large subunit
LLVGTLIDNLPATIVLTPIFLPVVTRLGMSPITFGVMISMNLVIGYITPPYGPNLFVTSAIANVPIEDMMGPLKYFFLALIAALMITTYWPPLTTMFL